MDSSSKTDPDTLDKEFQILKFGLEDARKNILERVKLRETALIFYLGAVATIIGIALKNDAEDFSLLLVIPFLSLGITLIISFHNSMMNALSFFIANELEYKLTEKGINTTLWDSSKAMNQIANRATRLRAIGYLFLIMIPAIFSLLLTINQLHQSHVLTLWIIGLLCLIFVFYIFNLTLKQRRLFHEIMSMRNNEDNN